MTLNYRFGQPLRVQRASRDLRVEEACGRGEQEDLRGGGLRAPRPEDGRRPSFAKTPSLWEPGLGGCPSWRRHRVEVFGLRAPCPHASQGSSPAAQGLCTKERWLAKG